MDGVRNPEPLRPLPRVHGCTGVAAGWSLCPGTETSRGWNSVQRKNKGPPYSEGRKSSKGSPSPPASVCASHLFFYEKIGLFLCCGLIFTKNWVLDMLCYSPENSEKKA